MRCINALIFVLMAQSAFADGARIAVSEFSPTSYPEPVAANELQRARPRLAVAAPTVEASNPDQPVVIEAPAMDFSGNPALDPATYARFIPSEGTFQRVPGKRFTLTLSAGRLFWDSGQSAPLASLWRAATGEALQCGLVDPHIFYDAARDRFTAVFVGDPGRTSSAVLIAVSGPAGPDSPWSLVLVRAEEIRQQWLDEPRVTLDGDNVTLTAALRDFTPAESCAAPPAPATAVAGDRITYDFDLTGARSAGRTASSTLAAVPNALAVFPSVGSGASQSFTFTFSDPDGFADLQVGHVLINSTLNGVGACFVTYFRGTNQLGLLNDNSTFYSLVTPGANVVVSNSQCSLNGSQVFVSPFSTDLSITMLIEFKSAFGGTKTIHMNGVDNSNGSTGWVAKGAWTVPSSNLAPQVASIDPTAGAGTFGTFFITYVDPNGAADIRLAHGLINSGLSGVNACFFTYFRDSNQIGLMNDASTAYQLATLGSGTVIQNSQCSISAASVTASRFGNEFRLTLSATFAGSFAGARTVFALATDTASLESGWTAIGSWTVPSLNQPPRITGLTPNNGTGQSSIFTLTVNDPDGPGTISTAHVMINDLLRSNNSCFITFFPATNEIGLMNDAGTTYTRITANVTGTAQNSQCSINGLGSGFGFVGSDRAFTVQVTFAQNFSGIRNLWVRADDNSGLLADWQVRGSWAIPTTTVSPFSLGLAPASGSGSSTTFSASFSHVNGTSRLQFVQILINSGLSGVNACMVAYFPGTNQFALMNDGSTAFTFINPGQAATISNSQCSINGTQLSAFRFEPTLSINVPVTFLAGFSGRKQVYVYARDIGVLASGWEWKGTWDVP